MPKDSFSQELMIKYWKEYAEMLNTNNEPLLYSAMIRENPILKGNTIICSLVNNSLASRFETESVKLLQFLREKLNNYSIKIETPIIKLEETKQIYTSRDRYNHLLKKNPLLKDFVTKMKLDLG